VKQVENKLIALPYF